MTYTFLLINLILIVIPFALMLDHKVIGVDKIKSTILPSIIVTFVFSEVAVFLTGLKAWNFNLVYLIGSSYRGLPLEEYLFLFAFSFAGLGVYNYLNAKFPKNELQKYSLTLSNIMMGICIAFIFFGYDKWYTVITFSFLILLLFEVEYINKLRFMYRFYRVFVVMLIPFYIIYGIFCNLPILQYDIKQNIGFSLFKIPFENYFFTMATLLLGVYLMETLKSRRKA